MTRTLTTFCAHRREEGADDLARLTAREALVTLTEREKAMFALSMLIEVETPVLCGLMGTIAYTVQGLADDLRRKAARVEEAR